MSGCCGGSCTIKIEKPVNGETNTNIVDNGDGTFTYTNEDGVPVTVDMCTCGQSSMVDNGDGTYTYTDADGNETVISAGGGAETPTTLVDDTATDGTFTYTNEDGTDVTVDICAAKCETCRPSLAEIQATSFEKNSTTDMFDENSAAGDEVEVICWTVPGSCSDVLVDIRPHIQILLDRQETPFFLEYALKNNTQGTLNRNRFVYFEGTEHDSVSDGTAQTPSTDRDEDHSTADLQILAAGGDELCFCIILGFAGSAVGPLINTVSLSQTYLHPMYTFEPGV